MSIFTNSNADASNSVRMSHSHVSIIKDAYDVSTFKECGYFCVLAYDKQGNRLLYVHCNSVEEYQMMMDPAKFMKDRDMLMYGY